LKHDRYEELDDLEENSLGDVDLFLVDLKFGNEDKGQEFISKIREKYFTDILFYSSDSKAIMSSRSKGEFEGVYFAIRDENKNEIKERIKQLIDKMIKRSNSPLALRGLVLGCVAELDNIVKEKIRSLLLKIGPEKADKLMDDCTKLYYESYSSNSDKIKNFFGTYFHNGKLQWPEVKEKYIKYEVSNLIENVAITDSNKNFRVLLKTYEALNGKDDTYGIIKNFTDLLSDRNIFAHVKEEKSEDGQYQFKRLNNGEYLVLSDEKCIELRTSIINYYEAISNIQ
jgi:predicted hydrocarbon binding protein